MPTGRGFVHEAALDLGEVDPRAASEDERNVRDLIDAALRSDARWTVVHDGAARPTNEEQAHALGLADQLGG
jgi:hypothetical protein